MTDREKLIELLESAESAVYWNSEDKTFIQKIADHLIANGVVISKKRNNHSTMDTRDGEAAGGKRTVPCVL